MKLYLRFKKWVEKKKIQGVFNKLTLGVAVLVVLLAILVTNDTALSRVLGLSTQAIPTPSPTEAPIIPTNTPIPTPTKTPQVKGQSVQREPVINCTGPDGKQFQTTQKECDDFNNAWRNKSDNTQNPATSRQSANVQPPETSSNNQASLIDCQTRMGTYKLTEYECSEYQKMLSQYVECQTAFYHYNWLTPEECEQYKKRDAAFVNSLNNIVPQQATPTPDNSYNQQQNSQCKMWANNWYINQGTQCGGSCAEAIKQLAYPEYQQKLKDCDSQYPI